MRKIFLNPEEYRRKANINGFIFNTLFLGIISLLYYRLYIYLFNGCKMMIGFVGVYNDIATEYIFNILYFLIYVLINLIIIILCYRNYGFLSGEIYVKYDSKNSEYSCIDKEDGVLGKNKWFRVNLILYILQAIGYFIFIIDITKIRYLLLIISAEILYILFFNFKQKEKGIEIDSNSKAIVYLSLNNKNLIDINNLSKFKKEFDLTMFRMIINSKNNVIFRDRYSDINNTFLFEIKDIQRITIGDKIISYSESLCRYNIK